MESEIFIEFEEFTSSALVEGFGIASFLQCCTMYNAVFENKKNGKNKSTDRKESRTNSSFTIYSHYSIIVIITIKGGIERE